MPNEKSHPEKPIPQNLIIFPGGGRKTKAEKLLEQFIDFSVIDDKNTRIKAYTALREAIYDHLPNYQVSGDTKS